MASSRKASIRGRAGGDGEGLGHWPHLHPMFRVSSGLLSRVSGRLLRRQTGLDVTWYYATHVGENSFKYEVITDIG